MLREAEYIYFTEAIWKPNDIHPVHFKAPFLIKATQAACKRYDEPNIWNLIKEVSRVHHTTQPYPNGYRAYLYDILTNNEIRDGDISIFDTIPTFIMDDSKYTKSTCAMCQEELKNESDVYELPVCKHRFHSCDYECLGEHQDIISWLIKHQTCPLCRTHL